MDPFTIKIKASRSIVEKLLEVMDFKKGQRTHYDLDHVIFERRKQNTSYSYGHYPNPILEMIANKES